MELNKENMKKIIGIIAFSIILYFVLENVVAINTVFTKTISILSPFLFGAGLAFIVNLPMKMFEKKLFKPKKMKNGQIKEHRLKRPISILLSVILIIIIISFIIKLVIPQLISVIIMFVREVPGVAYDIKDWAVELTEQYPDISNQIKGIEIDWDKVTKDVISFVSNLAGSLVTSSIGMIVSVVGGIFDSIVTLVFAIYILKDKEKLKKQATKIINAYLPEKKAKYMLEICDLANNTFGNFITSQFTEAIILGLLCFIGMLILKLPFAATISILIGVMALIPIVGAFIGIIIGAILILSVTPIKALVFVVFSILLQQFEGNVIYPRVVESSVGLPGMWVLVAVVVGGSLGGVLGLLLGLPTVSVLYVIFKNDVNKRLKEKSKA